MSQAALTNLKTGETFSLGVVSVIGRSDDGQIVVQDPRVSRRHAMVRQQDGGHYFFDLGSFNGSYLNGSRVTTTKQLKDGDTLDFADNHFRFTTTDVDLAQELEDLGGSTIAMIRSKPVIMIVSDIQGFTALSEKLPADEVAQLIGGWYGACESILSKTGATVDKFIGDCVLAYWTDTGPEQRLAALRAAHALHDSCETIYQSRKELFDEHGLTFDSGIAIHLGKVAYGGMSAGEFTLIGDPVNLTFRMEALTRTLRTPVIVSGEFLDGWAEGSQYCESKGPHIVKGRLQPVEVSAVIRFPE